MADLSKRRISRFPLKCGHSPSRAWSRRRKAFDSVMTAAQSAASAIEGQTVAAQAGAKDVQRKAVAFAERNVDASFDFARKLLAAKDGEEVLKLHAEYVKACMQALSEQARELGQTAGRAAGVKSKD